MGRKFTFEDEARFWELYLAGRSQREAAADVGASQQKASNWVTEAGGMKPRRLSGSVRANRYLSVQDRVDIGLGRAAGLSIRQIAARLGRSPSTISRELTRNSGGRAYQPLRAHHMAQMRARRPKPRRLHTDGQLRCVVQAMLRKKMSPEQISGRLGLLFGQDQGMQVSPETIYQAIYVQGRGSLRRELAACLRTGRAVRRPKRQGEQRRGRIPGMVPITDRPAEADDRAIPGHWEGDLLIGRDSKSAIGTLVERSTRYVMLLHLPDRHDAEAVRDEMIRAINKMPAQLRKTVTWDQGKEMSRHLEIRMATDVEVYFCDPHSPWQRGTNENTNGLLRQYFPKGTNLRVHSREHLDFVSQELNERPRKTLGFQTPEERLAELLSNPSNPTGVATTA